MIKLFAVVNGRIIEGLENHTTPVYSNTHYLLNELEKFDDIDVIAYSFNQLPKKGLISILYNNVIKTIIAFRSALALISLRPMVYFAYPHSLTTVQNRAIFWLCTLLKLEIVMKIHDTVEQANAVGVTKFALSSNLESYYLRKATQILALNEPMWSCLKNKYQIPPDKRVIFTPNAFEESFCSAYPISYKSMENRFNICYVGGLTKNRGIEILLKACEELHKRYPYLQLYIFGSYGEGVSQETKDTIERSNFILMRQVPRKDLLGALKDVDLFVMPYNPEESYMNFSSPTKFFEYIGTAKPILCTKCESLLDIGKNGGIIYVDYDAGDIVEKAELLIENPEIREEMSRDLIKLRPYHTWRERAKKFHEALKSLQEQSK